MKYGNSVLKNAFIDAYSCEAEEKHEPSQAFKDKMERLIRYQRGAYRLINTLGKRVACIFLIVLLCLTTVACSVEEIREPIMEGIESFFVNAKDYLKGTTADEVSHLFPEDVTRIVATDYISRSQKRYIIDDEEKIRKFIDLISNTYFRQPQEHFTANQNMEEDYVYWTFDFYNGQGKKTLNIKMCTDQYRIVFSKNGITDTYYVRDIMYRKLISFTNRELYLHDSAIELPKKEACEGFKNKITLNQTEEELKAIKKHLRQAHYSVEKLLLDNVSILKGADSVYWEYFLSGEEYTDPLNGELGQLTALNEVSSDLEKVISEIKDKKTRESFKYILKLWKESAKNHDIEGLFLVHEYIHDYDYFLYNYPTHYVYDNGADYQGIYDYFGHLAIK